MTPTTLNSPSSSSSLYPSIDMIGLPENVLREEVQEIVRLSPDSDRTVESSEDILVKVPGCIVHLIDKQQSLQLASGELTIVLLRQGESVVAVFARIGDEIQWPLARDEPAVKLDECHYFFTLRVPSETPSDEGNDDVLNYGLTVASKGQEGLLRELDVILEKYSAFSVQKVTGAVESCMLAKETTPAEMEKEGKKKELVEGSSAAFWTTLAPNVEDYSGSVARMIAAGTGQLIKGILWCGDVTVDRLKWGSEILKKSLGEGSTSNVSPEALKRVKRVKKLTKMSEKVATGILSGVVKVSGYFTSSIANSGVGKKFFSILPGEIVLASLDGFNKFFDALEVAGRNVMSTTSVVTTELVSERYGEQAGKVTHEGLGAAGHAIGTAWTVFKIRKALNPKSVIKPTTLAKAAAKANSAANFKDLSKNQ